MDFKPVMGLSFNLRLCCLTFNTTYWSGCWGNRSRKEVPAPKGHPSRVPESGFWYEKAAQLLSDDYVSQPIFKAELDHPIEEAHLSHLYLGSCFSTHDPRLWYALQCRSIHSFSAACLWSGHWGNSNIFQPLVGDFKAIQGQKGYIIFPVSSGSTPGSSVNEPYCWKPPEGGSREAS